MCIVALVVVRAMRVILLMGCALGCPLGFQRLSRRDGAGRQSASLP